MQIDREIDGDSPRVTLKSLLFQTVARAVVAITGAFGFSSLAIGQFVQPLGSTWFLDYQSSDDDIRVNVYAGINRSSDGPKNINNGGVYFFDVSGAGGNFADMQLFCVEINQNVPGSSNLYTLIDLQYASAHNPQSNFQAGVPVTGIGSDRADRLEVLYGTVFGTAANAFNPSSILNTAAKRNAFGLAVWELSHDVDFDLINDGGEPGFFVQSAVDSGDAGVLTLAQSYVAATQNAIATYGLDATRIQLAALSNSSKQDYIVVVPEPATWAALLGAASLLIVMIRRRRRNSAD